MNITLINPPSPYLDNETAYPPSGLMYLAAAIEENGHASTIVDLGGDVHWRETISDLSADLFGITCVTPNFNTVMEIATLLPAPVIIGGPHPTFLPDTLFPHCVVTGESEVVIRELLKDFETGQLKPIYHGGTVSVNHIPKPARHLLDLHRYTPGGEIATPIYSSRGCPFDCAFCSKITGRTYRVFPIERVIEEIHDALDLGFCHIVFGDDDIAIRGIRLRQIISAIGALQIGFRLNQDAKAIDDDIFALAAKAGCTEVSFGIESGSQSQLDSMNKRITVEQNARAIQSAQGHGMKAKAYLVVNFPGETDETIDETIQFIERTRPDGLLVSSFVPLPGSDTFSHPEKYGITWMSSDWSDYYLTGSHSQPCFTTDDLSFEKQIHLYDKLMEVVND